MNNNTSTPAAQPQTAPAGKPATPQTAAPNTVKPQGNPGFKKGKRK